MTYPDSNLIQLKWKPFPDAKDYYYAYAEIDSYWNTVSYYVHKLPDTHPVEEYRNQWTADVGGCTLFEYRPSKIPIFFDSIEDAQIACQRDFSALRKRG